MMTIVIHQYVKVKDRLMIWIDSAIWDGLGRGLGWKANMVNHGRFLRSYQGPHCPRAFSISLYFSLSIP